MVKQESGGQMWDWKMIGVSFEPNIKLFLSYFFPFHFGAICNYTIIYSVEKQTVERDLRGQNKGIILQELKPERLHLTFIRVKVVHR